MSAGDGSPAFDAGANGVRDDGAKRMARVQVLG